MQNLINLFKEFLGIGILPSEKYFVPKKKAAKTSKIYKHKLSLAEPRNLEIFRWWELPVQKDERAIFEEIENSVLYDELKVVLKESRLEVIELPATISAVMDKIHKKHFWYSEVVELIEKSPALTGDFLSIVNSAAFSKGMFIYDLYHALPRLGRKKIQSILFLNASKMSLPETPLFEKVSEEIIYQSQAVAKICRILAPQFGIDQNEAFLAGLLHNIGKIGLLKQISNHYNLPKDIDVEYHQSLFDNILPHFENNAAKRIGQYWKLENKIIAAITQHSSLDKMNRSCLDLKDLKLISLVNLAVYLSRILGYGNSITQTNLFELTSAKILNLKDDENGHRMLMNIYDSFQENEEAETTVA
ncbi:MAG: HDOD domain-containing protein [Lentisphaeraceae bacterium]|nr:HDOD domain-containing protein [Lentisphaeraceae bacterium]